MEDKALDKCLQTLKTSNSDTEKFAALLVVTKVIKADDCTSETRRAVFDAIGFQFLRRLMKTAKTPEGCPDYSFKNLAIIILHSFCTDDELATSSDMFLCLPQLNSIMAFDINHDLEETDVAAQEAMIKECYECLICISNTEDGRLAMINSRTVTALCHACVQKSYAFEHAEHLLHHLLVHNKQLLWNGNTDGFKVLVTHLSETFCNNTSEEVFVLCSKLEVIISSISKAQLSQTNLEPWASSIHKTLSTLLKSKLGKSQRNLAIRLASVLVNLLGIEWAVGTTEESRKFLLILVHLACVEVRMLLELDLKVEEVDCVETGGLLSSLYLLLENIINYLTSGPSLKLDDRQVQQLHSAMVGAFKAVIFFLSEVATNHKEKSQHPVVAASVRVLGAWMAEETTALSADVYQILPFLIDVGRNSFYAVQKLNQNGSKVTNPNDKEGTDIAEKMENLDMKESSKSVNVWTKKAGSMDDLASSTDIELDVFRFLLPGLCHLTAEDTARHILRQNNFHSLLGEYFSFMWKQYLDDAQREDAWVPIATLCGIFLNLVILDTELTLNHPVFSEMLEFTFYTIPGLVKSSADLTLNFNLSVLGLMLYRYIGNKLAVPRGDCDKFFNAVISLFRRAHCVEKAFHGTTQMRISESYRPEWGAVSELWFLGMQALSECIPKCPSISSCLLSSGWITQLLKSLKELEGQKLTPEISTTFQSLLTSLASSNSKAKAVIIEKGGVDIASSYKMKDLKKVLQK